MKRFILSILIFIFFIASCERSFSPLKTSAIILHVEYIGSTEIQLRLKVEEKPENASFEIYRNESLIQNGPLATNDTAFYYSGLLPSHTYYYKAVLLENGNPAARSSILAVTTKDTTSHEFTWEIDTLSYPEAELILPFAIWGSDTDDVWMVGNAGVPQAKIWHWDGEEWQAMAGNNFWADPRDIFGFSADDIWIAGSRVNNTLPSKSIHHWDGIRWSVVDSGILYEHCFSVWGSSSSSLFFGFDSGLIAYYDGNNFIRHETGTEAQIVDLFGFSDNDVYACGIEKDKELPRDSTAYYIFHFDGIGWSIMDSDLVTMENLSLDLPWRLWSNQPGILFGVNGRRIYQNASHSSWKQIYEVETAVWRLHGTDINNMFAAGYWGSSIYHFNGLKWKNFKEFRRTDFFGWAVFAIKDLVFIAGDNSYDLNAYIIRGKKKYGDRR